MVRADPGKTFSASRDRDAGRGVARRGPTPLGVERCARPSQLVSAHHPASPAPRTTSPGRRLDPLSDRRADRTSSPRAPFPATDVAPRSRGRKFPLKRAAVAANPTKLRASIAPGTILILLCGHFKGKRVVFLKQLDSGLLLVCGPYGVNGVPVKRVNQCYVIATSQKVDVSGVDVAKFNDAYFKKPAKDRSKKSEADFFAEEAAKKELPASYLEDNKALDAALGPVIQKVPHAAPTSTWPPSSPCAAVTSPTR